jgi:hypothetical protein
MARRALWLCLLPVLLLAIAGLLPPIAQPPEYHQFAEQRQCFGVPHCLDTLSNLPFIAVGLAGLIFLGRAGAARHFADPSQMTAYRLFFAAVLGVGLASGYYHLAPDNARLVGDRAAIGIALMAWFAALIGERASLAWGRRLLLPLLAAGLAGALYWGWSEQAGRGDLRPYFLVQLVPLLGVPLLLWLYPPRDSGDRDLVVVLCLYPLALACDLLDRPIAELTDLVGGHTLKHLLAAGAAAWVLRGLSRRQPLPGRPGAPP